MWILVVIGVQWQQVLEERRPGLKHALMTVLITEPQATGITQTQSQVTSVALLAAALDLSRRDIVDQTWHAMLKERVACQLSIRSSSLCALCTRLHCRRCAHFSQAI